MDSFSLRAVRGDLTGANPVDRAKRGSKLHLASEGTGLPLSLLVTAANTPDASVFEALLDDIPKVRTPTGGRRCRPGKCHADRPTTTAAAAATSPAGELGCGSLDGVSSRPPGWVATVGRRSARSPGWPGAGGCVSATTGTPSGSSRSPCWPARGWASTGCPALPIPTHGHHDRSAVAAAAWHTAAASANPVCLSCPNR